MITAEICKMSGRDKETHQFNAHHTDNPSDLDHLIQSTEAIFNVFKSRKANPFSWEGDDGVHTLSQDTSVQKLNAYQKATASYEELEQERLVAKLVCFNKTVQSLKIPYR